MGAARYMIDSGLLKNPRFVGVSGGAIVAALAAFFPSRIEDCLDVALKKQSFSKALETVARQQSYLNSRDSTSVDIGAVDVVTGEMISFSTFEDVDDLLEAVSASCYIPKDFHPFDLARRSMRYVDGYYYRNGRYYDGGLREFLPINGSICDRTLAISPFSVRVASKSVVVCCPDFNATNALTVRLGDHARFVCSMENLRRAVVATVGGSSEKMIQAFHRGADDCRETIERRMRTTGALR